MTAPIFSFTLRAVVSPEVRAPAAVAHPPPVLGRNPHHAEPVYAVRLVDLDRRHRVVSQQIVLRMPAAPVIVLALDFARRFALFVARRRRSQGFWPKLL